MKTLWIALLSASFVAGCATNASDPSEPDFDDPDAKADGAANPSGLYNVVETGNWDEFAVDIQHLDLRSDGTYFDQEEAPVDGGDGNYESGQMTSFGTYRFTKDSHGNRYIRFKDARDPSSTWRWRFRLMYGATNTLRFIYNNGDVGFDMKRVAPPASAFVAAIKAGYATAARTTAKPAGNWLTAVPYELIERTSDLEASHVTPLVPLTFKIDGKKVYAIEYGGARDAQVEVFAETGQLIAHATSISPMTWSTSLR